MTFQYFLVTPDLGFGFSTPNFAPDSVEWCTLVLYSLSEYFELIKTEGFKLKFIATQVVAV